MARRAWVVSLVWCLLNAVSAWGQQTAVVTISDPVGVPPSHNPDTGGILVWESQNFAEAGMHVESFWVPNWVQGGQPLDFSQGHFHHTEAGYETSHGFATGDPLLGPDRQGFYIEREDGGPFSLKSLDFELRINVIATDILIGTDYDPSLPAPPQMTAFPVAGQGGFQTLPITGFDDVTQVFVMALLGTNPNGDLVRLDNLTLEIPEGSCNDIGKRLRYLHADDVDPRTQGWAAEGGAAGVTEQAVADPNFPSWAVDDASIGADSQLAFAVYPNPDEMCMARYSGWILRATASVVDAPDAVDGSIFASYFDGLTLWELQIGADSAGDPIVTLGADTVTVTGVGPGHHEYEMLYDPATATVNVSVDGVPTILGNAGALQARVDEPRVAFGSNDDAGTGHAQWHEVEFSIVPECMDGLDNDGDGLTDAAEDPSCADARSKTERTHCSDGKDNDADRLIDFDGGASANGGVPIASPDPFCLTGADPYESAPVSCGLGFEMAPLLVGLAALRSRRRSPRRT
jgi:hypothetical protein